MGNYHNLDNAEVVFVYLQNKKFLEKYESAFEVGGIESYVELNENTIINSFKPLSEEELFELTKTAHYQYCLSVDEKLKPIVELIQEELLELYEAVENSFSSLQDEE